jgi:hypothetical protein
MREHRIIVRISEREKALLQSGAEKIGISMSGMIRLLIPVISKNPRILYEKTCDVQIMRLLKEISEMAREELKILRELKRQPPPPETSSVEKIPKTGWLSSMLSQGEYARELLNCSTQKELALTAMRLGQKAGVLPKTVEMSTILEEIAELQRRNIISLYPNGQFTWIRRWEK